MGGSNKKSALEGNHRRQLWPKADPKEPAVAVKRTDVSPWAAPKRDGRIHNLRQHGVFRQLLQIVDGSCRRLNLRAEGLYRPRVRL